MKPWERVPAEVAPAVQRPKPWEVKQAPHKGAFAMYAAKLIENGYSPIPVTPGTKRPPEKEWNGLRVQPYTLDVLPDKIRTFTGFGLAVAGGFNGLVPIDLDTEEAEIVDAICGALPQPLVAKKGQKGYASFYRAPDGWTPEGRKFLLNKAPIVEVLGTGKSIIPPTIHPDTRRPYEWLTPATLLNTRIEDLPQLAPDFLAQLADALEPWCPKPAPIAPSAPPENVSDARLREYALDVLAKRATILAGMQGESGRNNELLATVARVGSWVHHGILSESEVKQELLPAYEQCGGVKDHGRHQFAATIKSGLRMSANDSLRMPQEREDYKVWSAEPQDKAVIDALIASAKKKEVEEIVSNVSPFPAPQPVLENEFIFAGDFTATMPPALIRGLLPRNGLVVDGGQSGAGKTFAEVDMAVALAAGDDWFGQPVRERVGVVYIAAEGQSSIQRRFIAACRHRNLDIADLPIAIPNWASVNLRDPKKRIEIIRKLQTIDKQMQERYGVRLGCVIVDTISASCAMKDENSNSEVAVVCKELREIADATGAVLVGVHHFGKNEESGLRGGSAWRSNSDHVRVFLADRDGPGTPARNRRMALEKNRLGPEGETVEFDLATVSFGRDIYGDEVTECAIGVKGVAPRKLRLSKLETAVTQAFYDALAEYRHDQAMGLRPEERAVPVDDVRDKYEQRVAVGQERLSRKEYEKKRSAWNRAFEAAQKRLFKSETICGIEWLWPEQGVPV